MRQPPRRGKNADKGISDGLECVGGKPRGFHGAVDGTASEREPIGRLSSREVHRIHVYDTLKLPEKSVKNP